MKLKLVENSFRRNSKWNDNIDRNITLPKSKQGTSIGQALRGIVSTFDQNLRCVESMIKIDDIKAYVEDIKNNKFYIWYILAVLADGSKEYIFDRDESTGIDDFMDKLGKFYLEKFNYNPVISDAIYNAYGVGVFNTPKDADFYTWYDGYSMNTNYELAKQPHINEQDVKECLYQCFMSGAGRKAYEDQLEKLTQNDLKTEL